MEIQLGSLVVVLVHMVLALIAAYLSYIIYQYSKSRSWLAFTWAFILVFLRRLLGIALDYDLVFNSLLLNKIEGVLLIVISGLYIWGLVILKKEYESRKRK